MALFDKLRAELVDIVEWIDDSQHTLVWRFPRYRNQIKYGAQLIVRPGQSAVFVHQGRIADVFGPGHYRLETKNLPVLSTLMGWMHGFDSPFKAEIYFVSTRQLTDLKWGTSNPVPLRDPDFGSVRIRAFGTYTLRAIDPGRLLSELVGTDGVYEAEEVSALLRSIISMAFADVVASSGISVLDLAENYAELSETLRREVVQRIDDEYGLEIPQLYIVNVSVPAEVERALDARASMNAIGDMNAFQAYQLGNAMPEAAANPAGGLAGAGVGLGMGLAMTNAMGGIVGGNAGGSAGPASPTTPAGPPPVPTVAWHIAEGGESVGPFTPAQLAQAIASGRVGRDTLVWRAGMNEWAGAAEVEDLAGFFAPQPPPIPGA
ncbi:MAG TPA: SPFH domain-containing protein [Deltaproteobacteria bacterium]|nr:SPFH domain-containing protein [Deltaproteobacteria bacterium]